MIRKFLLFFNEKVKNWWFIVSLLTITSTLWFSLMLNFFGKQLHLIKINENGQAQLTWIGIICTFLTVGFTFLQVLSQRYYEYHQHNLNIDSPDSGEHIYSVMTSSFSRICNCKYNSLLIEIEKVKNNKIKAPIIVSNPCQQLKEITYEISVVLSELLTQKHHNIKANEIFVNIHYNYLIEDKNEWFVADNKSPEFGLNIKKLLYEKTTFKKLLESEKNYIFFNSKEEARKINCYYPDDTLDDYTIKDHSLKGSILCYEIIIKFHEIEYIKAIISVSTYTKKFVIDYTKDQIMNVSDNIKCIILNEFEKRICIELSLLYLSELFDKKAVAN